MKYNGGYEEKCKRNEQLQKGSTRGNNPVYSALAECEYGAVDCADYCRKQ